VTRGLVYYRSQAKFCSFAAKSRVVEVSFIFRSYLLKLTCRAGVGSSAFEKDPLARDFNVTIIVTPTAPTDSGGK